MGRWAGGLLQSLDRANKCFGQLSEVITIRLYVNPQHLNNYWTWAAVQLLLPRAEIKKTRITLIGVVSGIGFKGFVLRAV